MCVLSISYLTM